MNSLKYIAVALVACNTAIAPNINAQTSDDIENPWTECGIGAVIFSDNGTAAAISNIIWDLGTTAVSSKISSPDSCEGAKVKTAMFIQQTYPQLAQETAVGRGEHLDAMTNLLGCSTEASPQFIGDLRKSMIDLVADPAFALESDTQKAEKYFLQTQSIIKANYTTSCITA